MPFPRRGGFVSPGARKRDALAGPAPKMNGRKDTITMKKIAVLFLSLLLLLSGCAVTGEGVGVRYGLSGLILAAAGETKMDLTDLTTALEVAENEDTVGVRLSFEDGGGTRAEAVLAVRDGQTVLSLRGGDCDSAYILGDADAAASIEDFLRGMLPLSAQELTEEDFALSEEDLAQLQAQMEEYYASLSEEDLARMQAESEELSALMEECFRDGGTRVIDGVTYSITEIDISDENLKKMMEEYGSGSAEGGERSYSSILDGMGITVDVSGELGYSEEGAVFVNADMLLSDGQEEVVCSLGVDGADPETTGLTLCVESGDQTAAELDIDLLCADLTDAPWLELDLQNAVVVTSENSEAAIQQMTEDMIDCFHEVTSALAGSSVGDQVSQMLAVDGEE